MVLIASVPGLFLPFYCSMAALQTDSVLLLRFNKDV